MRLKTVYLQAMIGCISLEWEATLKSALPETTNRHDPEIFKALFEEILDRALKYMSRHKFRSHNLLYVIDHTTIDLCLNLYDWTYYRKKTSVQSQREYPGELRLIES